MIDIPPWMGVAQLELTAGVGEIAGPDDDPRVVEYHQTTTLAATDDEVPWCSSFVNWCMKGGGVEYTKSARARSWLKWGMTLPDRWIPYGAVLILKRGIGAQPGPNVIDAPGHVGFFAGYASPKHLLLLGGNQSNAVNISIYELDRLLGVRWPTHALW
jgi:uncharacterized protein (TIGR02594 family)